MLVCFVDAFDRRMSDPILDAAQKSWDMHKQKLVAMLGTKKKLIQPFNLRHQDLF